MKIEFKGDDGSDLGCVNITGDSVEFEEAESLEAPSIDESPEHEASEAPEVEEKEQEAMDPFKKKKKGGSMFAGE